MGRLVAAEFQKLFGSRLWLWLLLVSVAITALYTSLAIGFSGARGNPNPPLDTAQGQQVVLATSGGALTLAAVLGAIGLTGEFRHRTATATFLATPYRGRVVAAKLIAYGIVGAFYGVVCFLSGTAIMVVWLAAKGIDFTVADKGSVLLTVVVVVALFALVGVGLGALLREQVATVVGLLVYLYVVEPIITRIPGLGDWSRFLPGSAANAITQVSQPIQELLSPWQGALVLAGYVAVFALVGVFYTMRRDIA